MTETLLEEEVETIDTNKTGEARVILFNDDYHTFEEVIQQLILATSCSAKKAEQCAMTVHTKGKCNVYEGEYEECLHVSAVLQEINLKTEIEFS